MRALIFASYLALQVPGSFAQVSEDKTYASPAELRELGRRTLVVEMPRVNETEVGRYSKQVAATNEGPYRASIELYRNHIEELVRTHWKQNANIEFRTNEEIQALFARKSTQHVALLLGGASPGGYFIANSDIQIPKLALTRTDGRFTVDKDGCLSVFKADLQVYVPSFVDKNYVNSIVSVNAVKFAVVQMQQFLTWSMSNEGAEKYATFCEAQARKNCARLKGRQLMVREGKGNSLDEAEAKALYGNDLVFASMAALDSALGSGSTEKAVLLSFPTGTDPTFTVYLKLVVDPATDDILEAVVPRKERGVVGVNKKDLVTLSKCE